MIEIREMDDNYVLDACPLSEPLHPFGACNKCTGSQGRSKEIRRRFFRDVRSQYGNCVFFAWDQEKIVGFLMFFPKLVAQKIGLKTLPDDNQSDSTLVYACMQMATGYRGKGIGTGLTTELIAWARRNGWKRIEVNGVAIGDKDEHWRWGWALPKWRNLGFEVVRETTSLDVILDLVTETAEQGAVADG